VSFFVGKGPPRGGVPDSPSQLFFDLRRDPSVKFLWGHQEKVLDAFHRDFNNEKNVALELPTGSGKTLVGLLIAEFKRRSSDARSVFLCPTKQLAAQAHQASRRYGMDSVLLTGPQKHWPAASFIRYQRAQAIAVTTYSALFNTNPRLDNPDFIVCDDAHAADQYVGSLWTVAVDRRDHEQPFLEICEALHQLLPETIVRRIKKNKPAASNVELISTISLNEAGIDLAQVLEAQLPAESRYAFSRIADYLHACTAYVSATRFEIGPTLPPTRTHLPFENAKQRVYMSATLGDDGSIERSFGLTNLKRLPIPEGWDRRGTGRRLLLFPGLAVDKDETQTPWDICHRVLAKQQRALVLVPSNTERSRLVERLETTHALIGAADIESGVEPFVAHAGPAILLVANRFDGIDLPGEHCRCMVLDGLPDAASLQETYMVFRLGASALLRDRVRTRLTQAVGRCTRDESDYAAVLLVGDSLLKWFSTAANTRGMPVELQAEIEFGLLNSEREPDAFPQATNILLAQGKEWELAEDEIRSIRNSIKKLRDPEAKSLSKAAEYEVLFQYALWSERFDEALVLAEKTIDALSGGNELRPYASFWHHQAAVVAHLSWKQGQSTKQQICLEHLNRAAATSSGIRWLGRLKSVLAQQLEVPDDKFPWRTWYQNLSKLLSKWKLRGPRFSMKIGEAEDWLSRRTDTSSVEQLLERIGLMLGFETKRWPNQQAAPDGCWWLTDWQGFTFEAKYGATNEQVSVDDLRQTNSHPSYVKHNEIVPIDLPIKMVLASDHSKVDASAKNLATSVFHLSFEHLDYLFRKAASALEQVRASAKDLPDEAALEQARRCYQVAGVSPGQIATSLSKRPLSDFP